ncbi:16S rRNA (uracil(1498)-N(3))-methyltransferase [Polymorphobacter sp.]|uniref:16S rRNA (uracil(1498)-N(3))-methyltransferase n=1 Tax=Polymorphobacter sp. TaxID=1909290 RepID=UPI003F7283D2
MSENTADLSTTPRLYVEGPLSAGREIALRDAPAHYLGSVMRRQPGDMVRLFDGTSGEWAARVLAVARKSVTLVVAAPSAPQEAMADLWLCFAPLKRGRIDWLVEKACELGVARLVPVITRRTIVDRLNAERLQAHMIEAAEQCGRTALPVLAEPVTLPSLMRDWPVERALYFADETGGARLVETVMPGPAAFLVGPEGGFMTEEAAMIRAVPAAKPVSLGRRILRADTAAIAVISVWQALVGD